MRGDKKKAIPKITMQNRDQKLHAVMESQIINFIKIKYFTDDFIAISINFTALKSMLLRRENI